MKKRHADIEVMQGDDLVVLTTKESEYIDIEDIIFELNRTAPTAFARIENFAVRPCDVVRVSICDCEEVKKDETV